MKLKTLIVTVAVLAALSSVAFWLTRSAPPPSSDPRINQPMVTADLAENAAQLKISDQGKSVLLVRRSDGTWRIPDYFDFPVDFQKLSGFVNDLTSAKIEQLVTTNPQRLSRLEFKDTKIEFLNPADKPQLVLTLGKTAEAGGRFVRFDDEPRGYRANFNAWIDADAKSWADASLVKIKASDVAKVDVGFPHAPAVLATRSKADAPFTAANAPSGQTLNTSKVTSLLSDLVGLRFTETSAPTDPNAVAAKEHERTVTLTTFDGKTLHIALGRKPEEKIVKPAPAKADGKTGPASLGSVQGEKKNGPKSEGPVKALAPETETIPAGPVYAFVESSDIKDPINAMMHARSFQVYDYGFSTLPQAPSDLFEPVTEPPKASPGK